MKPVFGFKVGFKAALAALYALFAASLFAAAPQSALVSTEWLAKNLKDPNLRIIEVSVNPGVYERSHIPGAVNFSWHSDLNDKVRRDIVSRDNFEKLLQQAGVTDKSTIILYGDTNNWFAAWGAWVFDIYGVQNVKLLDGGRVKWEAENRPQDNRVPEIKPTKFKLGKGDDALRARLSDAVAAAEGKSQTKLLDIRSPDEYSGKVFAPAGIQELSIRAGHIPSAVNVPWGKAVNADGTFKSAAELKELYAGVGIDGKKPIITYCRIGERSSHSWFALKKILGYDVKNYDGSWTEYGNAVGVPIVNQTGTIWSAK
ncbi:MAG: sulfurtransferase [Helicobacteraceae bacterium]|jgi:thiosulfate/3-mercaptopyruvate sulfurtransferase|nr:sulfurtransferase [Helicobacteraceae bacterium]